jgi:S1-C subfamily serine protease
MSGEFATCRIVAFPHAINYAKPFLNPTTSKGVGSGFFVRSRTKDPDLWLVLTCYHVVANSANVQVVLPSSGRDEFEAKILSVMPDHDMAALSVRLPREISASVQALVIGNSDQLRAGSQVQAFGFPLASKALKHSDGMFAGLSDNGLLQTTAPLSPGNSGGPLVYNNTVVGIVSAKIVALEASNVGFAVPINLFRQYAVKMVIERTPVVLKPLLGICVQRVPPSMKQDGVMVVRVNPQSSLIDVLQPGDIITSCSWDSDKFALDEYGEATTSWSASKLEMMDIIDRAPLDGEICLDVVKGETTRSVCARRQVELRAGLFRRVVCPQQSLPYLCIFGICFVPLCTELILNAQQGDKDIVSAILRIAEGERSVDRLVVSWVVPNSDAAEFVKPGDFLSRVNENPISTVDELREQLCANQSAWMVFDNNHIFSAKASEYIEKEGAWAADRTYVPDTDVLSSWKAQLVQSNAAVEIEEEATSFSTEATDE